MIAIDIETSGLSPRSGHRVIEIACVEVVAETGSAGNFNTRLASGRLLDEATADFLGAKIADYADAPEFTELAESFLTYLENADLLMHHAKFDLAFLDSELEQVGLPVITGRFRIWDVYAECCRRSSQSPRTLDALCAQYGISRAGGIGTRVQQDAQLIADLGIALGLT